MKNISYNTLNSPIWLSKLWRKYYAQEYWIYDPVTFTAYFREVFLLNILINASTNNIQPFLMALAKTIEKIIIHKLRYHITSIRNVII